MKQTKTILEIKDHPITLMGNGVNYQFYAEDGIGHLNVTEARSSLISFDHTFEEDDELEEIIEDHDYGIRICDECHCPMVSGYTDELGDMHLHSDEEFKSYMDEQYGENCWRAEKTGTEEWNYEYLENGRWNPAIEYATDW